MDYSTYIGYALFAVSEILPFIPIPQNGILHTIVTIVAKFLNIKLPEPVQTEPLQIDGNTLHPQAVQMLQLFVAMQNKKDLSVPPTTV